MFDIKIFTPERNHPNEEHILHALVRAHNATIHVRKPDFTEEEYRLYLSDYASILSHMVLHEHHVLAKEFSVKGIHLKERDRKSATEIQNGVKIISTSLHMIEDAKNLSHAFDYVFYSPIFKSISKENYGINTAKEELASIIFELKKHITIPIIGLGGINEDTIGIVKACGFDGAALLGAVWQSQEPLKAFENCLRLNA